MKCKCREILSLSVRNSFKITFFSHVALWRYQMNLDKEVRRKTLLVISQTTRLLKLEDININIYCSMNPKCYTDQRFRVCIFHINTRFDDSINKRNKLSRCVSTASLLRGRLSAVGEMLRVVFVSHRASVPAATATTGLPSVVHLMMATTATLLLRQQFLERDDKWQHEGYLADDQGFASQQEQPAYGEGYEGCRLRRQTHHHHTHHFLHLSASWKKSHTTVNSQ